MKKLIAIAVVTITLLAFPRISHATGTVCKPIYGGGQTCVQEGNISINKTVFNPQTNSFVENLGVNDTRLGPDQEITFRIEVTNTGGTTLSKVIVEDTFPQFLTPTTSTKVEIKNLKAKETKIITMKGKAFAANKLPNQEITCVTNQVKATADKNTASDNTQFCIQKQVLGAAQPPTTKGGKPVFPQPQVNATPSTGPEMLALFGLIPAGLAGIFIRTRASQLSSWKEVA